MSALVLAHGTEAVLLLLALASVVVALRRTFAARRVVEARHIEFRNTNNAVGALGRRIILDLEQARDRHDLWRDMLAYAAVLAAIAAQLGVSLSSLA